MGPSRVQSVAKDALENSSSLRCLQVKLELACYCAERLNNLSKISKPAREKFSCELFRGFCILGMPAKQTFFHVGWSITSVILCYLTQ